MACVVVGIATVDLINVIPSYPPGGNGTNTLVICAQLGKWSSLHWIGSLVDPGASDDARFICDDLSAYGIDISQCQYIMASEATGSRTIFHARDLPEVSVDHFRRVLPVIGTAGWVHFECRNALEQLEMIEIVHRTQPTAPISIEVESSRHAWHEVQQLLPLASVAFVAKGYVTALGHRSAHEFCQHLEAQPDIASSHHLRAVVIPWGEVGAYYYCMATRTVHHVPVEPLATVVDAVGAGDTLVAATISALVARQSIAAAVAFGCEVARAKCTQAGLCFSPDTLQGCQRALLH
ncbi:ketohexokinase [Achlya hypogyna]|uniref:Ketohexokinase n=1 Tax=Achlya hypogyna TaxID=1202772 RepID=A0A1V9YI89_ACHHY|nr:ketohexokinase [Achlya hypogyna]